MQQSNKFYLLFFIIFSSCNFKDETNKGLIQENNKSSVFYDTIELIESKYVDKQDTFKDCKELQGTWIMIKYIPTMNDKQKLDTDINLRIEACKLIKTKFGNVIDSTLLIPKFENKRNLFYWQNVEDRYIRYVPEKDIIILNKKGFDGGIEHYERKKR